mmetsp:Transcript_49549/g.160099  ORF Transcript_49549/g.160099 Transcript_49549/m.160099 type:complete len:211 (+) Transcript_49549:506-1138(+)
MSALMRARSSMKRSNSAAWASTSPAAGPTTCLASASAASTIARQLSKTDPVDLTDSASSSNSRSKGATAELSSATKRRLAASNSGAGGRGWGRWDAAGGSGKASVSLPRAASKLCTSARTAAMVPSVQARASCGPRRPAEARSEARRPSSCVASCAASSCRAASTACFLCRAPRPRNPPMSRGATNSVHNSVRCTFNVSFICCPLGRSAA